MTGTGALVRLILRRDRVLMPIWVLFMAVLPLSLASGTASLYPTDEARQGYIDDLSRSSLLVMFYGQTPEPVLATRVSRWRWAASHLVFALLGPTVAMAACGPVAGLVHGANTGDIGRELPRVLAGAMVQLPAVWLLAALTVATFGLLPPLAPAVGWVALSICLLLGQVGALLRLSQPLLDISPFTHIPRVPGTTVAATPLLTLSALAAVLIAIGLTAFRRRDIPVT